MARSDCDLTESNISVASYNNKFQSTVRTKTMTFWGKKYITAKVGIEKSNNKVSKCNYFHY
jgi:LPS O-antigen subunit length determinant protein (WzzB/FepE family)